MAILCLIPNGGGHFIFPFKFIALDKKFHPIESTTDMEICRVPRQLPPIKIPFDRTPPFRPATVRCNLFPNTERSPELSIGGRMFILGMGFVGQFFAADLKTKGWVVSGSCTSVAKKIKLEDLGYQAYVFDANDPQSEILEIVKNHTHLVVSIPPLKGLGDPLHCHKGLVESILKDGRLQWLVYLSSTSTYGDCGGAWVDEDYPVKPANELGRARIAAEEEWLCLGRNLGIAAQVFRLGGIYGPGRSAVDTILKQEPLSKGQRARQSKSYTSRIHVADICQALHACVSKPSAGKIYNIVDDDPAPREEVFDFAQKLVGQKFPSRVTQYIFSERAESLAVEKSSRGEKRVSNASMKKELGVKLLHPTYRSGLQSIIEHMDSLLLPNSLGIERGMKYLLLLNSFSYSVKENKACMIWAERYFKYCFCNMRDELSFGFGLISFVFWGVAEIPQIITNFKTKSSHGVSFLFLLTWIVGDVFNLVGCLLEPATLPMQFYTAVLYTSSTMVLVLQSLYYDYFPKWKNGREKESHEVEEVKNPLLPPTPTYSAIPIPNGADRAATQGEVYSFMRSARSMAGSTTPPVLSSLCSVKSGSSAVGTDDDPSSDDDEANNTIPVKKYASKAIPIPPSVGHGAFLATLISSPRVTKALMQVYVGSTGRKLLKEHGTESAYYGQWLGWMMAAIYVGGRLPQIWLNIKRGTVEGLNPLMFVFSLAANATYVASILVRSIAWDKIKSNMPWLLDAVGCIVLDIFITLQYVYYRYFSKRVAAAAEYRCYIEENKD